ncbi:hypothetical protein HZI73_18120 [Vallitalea pronyensis]|uniref:Uncharacterized protein n=1 Tax=Vallitalea pronyensis TaxID=1348613 RepID=A0A8J8MM71_9FIRM|nr:PEP/pyruvate-binding domain-containing protein [Vallitalea pronyensis]QUI24091.1 hypothetical protein HZI73_18120 [Vallitalea pronyensis]
MIQSLKQLSKKDNLQYGSKAANIGELSKNIKYVPKGFALDFSCLETYLTHNAISYTPDDYMAYSQEIRQAILQGHMPPSVRACVTAHLDSIRNDCPNTTFAVRSSSNLEDGLFRSMAGMFTSYIQLDISHVEEAIKKVFASLYADVVLDYLLDNNIPFQDLKMGVIVQEFIKGSPSGVIFTADTVHMNTEHMQINGVNSICGDYVDGSAPSCFYRMEKDTKKILAYSSDDVSLSLTPEILVMLHDQGKLIEGIFGCPQDIEWTYANHHVYILQSRPITTIKTSDFPIKWRSDKDALDTWYRLFPTPYTPLMEDIIQIECEEQSKGVYETVFRTDLYGEFMIQHGYAYVKPLSIKDAESKRKAYLDKLFKNFSEGKCIFCDTILPEINKLTKALNRYTDISLSAKEIIDYIHLSVKYLTYTWRQHWHATQANEFLVVFEEKILDMFDDLETQDCYDLIYGFSLLARERELLYLMTSEIKRNPILMDMFHTYPYDTILYERLKREPAAGQFLELMAVYMAEYGICDAGLDAILHPTAKERPDYCMGQVRHLLSADEKLFFQSKQEALLRKVTLKDELLSRLDIKEQSQFLDMIALAEKSLLANDNHHYYMERSYRGYLRLATIEAGKWLCAKGLMVSPEDVQFLHLDEILKALENRSLEEHVITHRKNTYALNKQMLAPEIIGHVPEKNTNQPHHNTPSPSHDTQIILKGLSGMRKKVIGKIYLGKPNTLEGDRILVLPHCHCGDIMSCISKVKGIIYNWGSPYDHYGIITRELEIPSIYKTNDATEVLKNNDLVELDGYTGTITVLERAKDQ